MADGIALRLSNWTSGPGLAGIRPRHRWGDTRRTAAGDDPHSLARVRAPVVLQSAAAGVGSPGGGAVIFPPGAHCGWSDRLQLRSAEVSLRAAAGRGLRGARRD